MDRNDYIQNLNCHNKDLIDKEDIYLEDLSNNSKPWDKHRKNADRIANFYRGTEDFDKYADRIMFCSQLLDFKLCSEEKEYKLKLNTARFCRVRYCPVCQWRRSLKWKAKAYNILPQIVEEYPNYRWLFLTLTVKNCPITELKYNLQWLNKSWQRMSQRKIFPAIGWIRTTEVTKAQNRYAHPHFHCLLLVKPSYFGKYYIKQTEWVEIWKHSLRIDYNPIVHIKPIKRDRNPIELVPEILKYCVKESDLISDEQWFLELTRQTYKMRSVATGGMIKSYCREIDLNRRNNIDNEESNLIVETDGFHLYFSWQYKNKKYSFNYE